ncbi:hypothetical protein HYR99_16105 [Candidatus Poribacteria bacterium]|nr:hypothetical protein [Candidatus Poribacteria bacterium]
MNNPLKHIYNACDPYKPATAEYYLDCSEARGAGALTIRFQSHLDKTQEGNYLRFLFSGHVGCGKSSELEQLKRALSHPTPLHARYFSVLLNVFDYLDEYDVDTTDILLAIVTEVAATLRLEIKVELKDNYFVKRINEIKEFFLSDVEINEGELSLWKAKLKIQRLKRDPIARQKVREALAPKMSTMLEEINTVFDEARLAVKKASQPPYTDLVLILDNLEKLQRFAGKEEGLASQRELFLERAPQLTGLQAHVIYTVPLRLSRSDGSQLRQRYGVDPFVLPMVKVIERSTRTPFQPGLDCLHGLLQKRVDELSLDEVFAPDALDFLLTYSGGHTRDLMIFVREACTYSDNIPISLKAAHQAIGPTVRSYGSAIPEKHWGKLARLDQSADQKIDNDDEDYLAMLENLSVLEYRNGSGDDPFILPEPWYAVNPIVRELQKFKTAVNSLSEVSAS